VVGGLRHRRKAKKRRDLRCEKKANDVRLEGRNTGQKKF
jgi:hypothetical protein